MSNVQIYDLNGESWISSANNMNTARGRHACIVKKNNNYLYVFGGSSGSGNAQYLNKISRLYVGNMANINQYNWNDLSTTLSISVFGLHAVSHHGNIYIVGGRVKSGGSSEFSVNVDRLGLDDRIAAETNLLQSTSYASCIVINDKLFVIGGYDSSTTYIDAIQHTILPRTPNPTVSPTNEPTQNTLNPTTAQPTPSPTDSPTIQTILSWSISKTELPRPDDSMAVAYSATKDRLWVIGGYIYKRNLVSFEVSTLTSDTALPLITNATDGLSVGIDFTGQGWTQIDDILYMIDGYTFSVFNVATEQFMTNYRNITIPQSMSIDACLSHIENFLILIRLSSTPIIYDLDNKIWILTANNMNTGRHRAACIVHERNKYLYVFGGQDSNYAGAVQLDTIIKLYVGDIENIDQYFWTELDDKFDKPLVTLRAVSYNDDIYIVGGRYFEAGTTRFSSDVYKLSVLNDTLDRDFNLLKRTAVAPTIIVNNLLIVIGGYFNLTSPNNPNAADSFGQIHSVTIQYGILLLFVACI